MSGDSSCLPLGVHPILSGHFDVTVVGFLEKQFQPDATRVGHVVHNGLWKSSALREGPSLVKGWKFSRDVAY